DFGAHRGVYTIFLGLASGPAGRVLAVEPDPRSLVRLRANLQLNQLEPRVQIEEVAIGAERGEVELSLCDEYMAAVNGGPGPSVRVALWRGDSLLDACQFPPPQVIKLDVEGYEDAVLAGLEQVLRQPACRLVCCEVHPHKLPPGIAAAAIGDRLERHGFTHQYKLPRAPEFHLLASRVPLPAWRS
ncbi:MAG: FkbM family methyltransferase, partial [Terriglobales bacterium]